MHPVSRPALTGAARPAPTGGVIRRRIRLLAIVLLAIPLLACSIGSLAGQVASPTGTPTAAAVQNIITNAVMAKDVQGANFDPVGITDAYPSDQKKFHAVVTIANAPTDTAVRAVWTAVDVGNAAAPNTRIDQFEIKSQGSRNLDFTLTPDGDHFPAGTYKVDLYVNDKFDRTLNFTVAAGQAAGVTPTTARPTTAPSTVAPPTGSSTTNLISSVTMARDTQGDNKDPVNPTTVFAPNAVFHAVVAIKNAPANTKFTAAWYVTDVGSAAAPNTLIDSTDLTTGGTRNLDFTLSPNNQWPAGTYRVEISINGTRVTTANFSVSGSGASATPAPTGPAPSTSSSGASMIAAVTMAEDTKGDNFDPVNPTTVFKPSATFHAVVSTKSAPANTKVKAVWYVTDVGSAAAPNTLIDSYELTTEGTRNLDFTLAPKTNWPTGKYRVEIQVNGTTVQTVNFTVQ